MLNSDFQDKQPFLSTTGAYFHNRSKQAANILGEKYSRLDVGMKLRTPHRKKNILLQKLQQHYKVPMRNFSQIAGIMMDCYGWKVNKTGLFDVMVIVAFKMSAHVALISIWSGRDQGNTYNRPGSHENGIYDWERTFRDLNYNLFFFYKKK